MSVNSRSSYLPDFLITVDPNSCFFYPRLRHLMLNFSDHHLVIPQVTFLYLRFLQFSAWLDCCNQHHHYPNCHHCCHHHQQWQDISHSGLFSLHGVGLAILSLIKLSLFCWLECIHTVTYEHLYFLFLIIVVSTYICNPQEFHSRCIHSLLSIFFICLIVI